MATDLRTVSPNERREAPAGNLSPVPAVLVATWVETANRQLLRAREELKAARRRVVQLEDVVGSWKGIAESLRDRESAQTPCL